MGGRMEMRYTRSGLGPTWVDDPPLSLPVLPVVYYAPKPLWMTHHPGPWLRFYSRTAFEAHLRRSASRPLPA